MRENWPRLPRMAVETGCGKFTGGEAEGRGPSLPLPCITLGNPELCYLGSVERQGLGSAGEPLLERSELEEPRGKGHGLRTLICVCDSVCVWWGGSDKAFR